MSDVNVTIENSNTEVNVTLENSTGLGKANLAGGNTFTGLQNFKDGVLVESNLMANNSTSGTAKYLHVARIVINSAYNRVNFQLEYFSTGTTPRKGSIDGYVYSTVNYQTFSIQSYIQIYCKDKFAFSTGDVKILKSTSSLASKSVWDIYSLVSDYGKAYINGMYGFAETGQIYVNPSNGVLLSTLPIVSDTFEYNGNTFTVNTVDNGVIKTTSFI